MFIEFHRFCILFGPFGASKVEPSSRIYWAVRLPDLADKSLGYQYTTTLHWALCQLGMGSNIIEVTNVLERLFGILVVLVAMVTFSPLISL